MGDRAAFVPHMAANGLCQPWQVTTKLLPAARGCAKGTPNRRLQGDTYSDIQMEIPRFGSRRATCTIRRPGIEPGTI